MLTNALLFLIAVALIWGAVIAQNVFTVMAALFLLYVAVQTSLWFAGVTIQFYKYRSNRYWDSVETGGDGCWKEKVDRKD